MNEAGKYQDAIKIYNEDLQLLPKNGWALHGLKLAHAKVKDEGKVAELEDKLHQVWATADIELLNSRVK